MMSNSSKRFYFLLFALLIFAVLSLSGYFHAIDREAALGMLHEDGAVEKLSALGYFLCLLVMAFSGGARYLRTHFSLAAFAGLLGMRELDFDKRFTDTGLLQSRIFTSADVAPLERVLGIALMVMLLVLLVVAVRKYALVFLKRLLRVDPAAIGISLAVGLMVLSKSIDGLGRKLQPLGVSISEDLAFSATVFEEVFELGIPVALMIATVAYLKRPALTTERLQPAVAESAL